MTGRLDERDADAAFCRDLLKSQAVDLYLATLLGPHDRVTELMILRAFHGEMVKIVSAAREPLAGEIRLRWWADAFTGLRSAEASGHPLYRATRHVLDTYDLPTQPLYAKAEVHIAELYSDPFPDRETLEGHLGETHSTQFHMAASLCGAPRDRRLADASGHAGVALGVTDLLCQSARHRSRSQVFVPLDVLEEAGLSAAQYLEPPNQRHEQAIRSMVELATRHYESAVEHIDELPDEIAPVFKPLALVPLYLKRIEAKPAKVLMNASPLVSQLRRQWTLWTN